MKKADLACFGSKDERRLQDLRQKFYTAIPELKDQLYQELIKRGFFTSNPDSIRQRWRGLVSWGLWLQCFFPVA